MNIQDPRFAILEQRIALLKADMQTAIEQMGQLLGQVVQMNQKYQDSVEKQLTLLHKAIGERDGSDIPESSEK